MFPVEIIVNESSETAITAEMNMMREWLDRRRFEPSTFQYRSDPPGLVFQVDFNIEAEAVAFADAFGGRVLPSGTGQAAAD